MVGGIRSEPMDYFRVADPQGMGNLIPNVTTAKFRAFAFLTASCAWPSRV